MHEAVLLCKAVLMHDSVIAVQAVFVCFKLCVSVRAEADSPTGERALRSSGKQRRCLPFPAVSVFIDPYVPQ